MSKSQQQKGRRSEIELTNLLQSYGYPVEVGKPESYGSVPDLSGLPGIHIECKRVEKLNISKAMAQAVKDSEKFKDGVPAVFHRRNREGWLVTMRLEDFMEIYGGDNGKVDKCKGQAPRSR